MAKKKFMSKAVKNPGGLHKALHVPQGQKIPAAKVAKAAGAGGRLGKMGQLAQTFAKFRPK